MKRSILIITCVILVVFLLYMAQYTTESNMTVLAVQPESITNSENDFSSLNCRCRNEGQCVPGNNISFRPSCSKHVINGNITEEQKEHICKQYYNNCEQ